MPHRCHTRELPNQVPTSAVDKLIQRFTSGWAEIASDLLEDVRLEVETMLEDLIETTFGRYTYGNLPGSVM